MAWIQLPLALFVGTMVYLSSGQREQCPLEIDFPSTVNVKGRPVHCSTTPEEHECEWDDIRHYACHDLKVDSNLRVSRSDNITLDSAYADLCLDMLEEVGEGLGRTATGRVNASTPGTIHYSTEGVWTVLSDVGLPNSNQSYIRVACQTSGVVRDVDTEGRQKP